MSASSPIWRGYLSDIDCRWHVLCAMSDDRTTEEQGFAVSLYLIFAYSYRNFSKGVLNNSHIYISS